MEHLPGPDPGEDRFVGCVCMPLCPVPLCLSLHKPCGLSLLLLSVALATDFSLVRKSLGWFFVQ